MVRCRIAEQRRHRIRAERLQMRPANCPVNRKSKSNLTEARTGNRTLSKSPLGPQGQLFHRRRLPPGPHPARQIPLNLPLAVATRSRPCLVRDSSRRHISKEYSTELDRRSLCFAPGCLFRRMPRSTRCRADRSTPLSETADRRPFAGRKERYGTPAYLALVRVPKRLRRPARCWLTIQSFGHDPDRSRRDRKTGGLRKLYSDRE